MGYIIGTRCKISNGLLQHYFVGALIVFSWHLFFLTQTQLHLNTLLYLYSLLKSISTYIVTFYSY